MSTATEILRLCATGTSESRLPPARREHPITFPVAPSREPLPSIQPDSVSIIPTPPVRREGNDLIDRAIRLHEAMERHRLSRDLKK